MQSVLDLIPNDESHKSYLATLTKIYNNYNLNENMRRLATADKFISVYLITPDEIEWLQDQNPNEEKCIESLLRTMLCDNKDSLSKYYGDVMTLSVRVHNGHHAIIPIDIASAPKIISLLANGSSSIEDDILEADKYLRNPMYMHRCPRIANSRCSIHQFSRRISGNRTAIVNKILSNHNMVKQTTVNLRGKAYPLEEVMAYRIKKIERPELKALLLEATKTDRRVEDKPEQALTRELAQSLLLQHIHNRSVIQLLEYLVSRFRLTSDRFSVNRKVATYLYALAQESLLCDRPNHRNHYVLTIALVMCFADDDCPYNFTKGKTPDAEEVNEYRLGINVILSRLSNYKNVVTVGFAHDSLGWIKKNQMLIPEGEPEYIGFISRLLYVLWDWRKTADSISSGSISDMSFIRHRLSMCSDSVLLPSDCPPDVVNRSIADLNDFAKNIINMSTHANSSLGIDDTVANVLSMFRTKDKK